MVNTRRTLTNSPSLSAAYLLNRLENKLLTLSLLHIENERQRLLKSHAREVRLLNSQLRQILTCSGYSNEGVPPEATKVAKTDGIEFLYGINMYDPSHSIQQRTQRRSLGAPGKITRSESARPSRFVRPSIKERLSTASDDLTLPSNISRYGMPIFNASDNSDVEPTKLMKLVKRRKTQERKLRFNEAQVARIQEKLYTFCTHTE